MKPQIIDIGINLMHRQFENDRKEVVLSAFSENITPLIITGTNLKESRLAAGFAKKFNGKLYSTAGFHPHDAKICSNEAIEEIKILLKKPHVVAVGECGLDYDRNFSPRDIQKKWFIKQIEIAEELKKPLFLHERAAFKDLFSIMSEHRNLCENSVVHCFTGNENELEKYLELGCFIGITGWICDERRGKNLRSIIKRIPLNKLMIETDAPFLIPRNMNPQPKSRRNEPIYLRHILNDISICLEKDIYEISETITKNTKKFFKI